MHKLNYVVFYVKLHSLLVKLPSGKQWKGSFRQTHNNSHWKQRCLDKDPRSCYCQSRWLLKCVLSQIAWNLSQRWSQNWGVLLSVFHLYNSVCKSYSSSVEPLVKLIEMEVLVSLLHSPQWCGKQEPTVPSAWFGVEASTQELHVMMTMLIIKFWGLTSSGWKES